MVFYRFEKSSRLKIVEANFKFSNLSFIFVKKQNYVAKNLIMIRTIYCFLKPNRSASIVCFDLDKIFLITLDINLCDLKFVYKAKTN